MTPDEQTAILDLIAGRTWVFAKTMPHIPHYWMLIPTEVARDSGMISPGIPI